MINVDRTIIVRLLIIAIKILNFLIYPKLFTVTSLFYI